MKTTRYAAFFLILASSAKAQPVISAIVNAGSGLLNASPGCMQSIYGTNLAPSTAGAPAGNLPTTLNGVSVTVGGMPAPLKYVSAGQINFQIPFEAASGSTSVVVNNASASAPFSLQLQPSSPGLISIDPTHSLIIGSDFQLKSTVQSGDAITLYVVGLGPTSPPTPTGAAGNTQEPLNRVITLPTLMIGGRPAMISFAGMAPLFPGVYQINATVPLTPLDNSMVLQSGTVSSSNIVSFANTNVSNVTGSVNLLYPLSTSMVTFSPVPVIASYSVSFDVAANAQLFTVVAESSAGTSTFTVSPFGGNISGNLPSPTAAERAGSFAGSGLNAIDFLANGLPFPGNIIPVSRLDPMEVAALQNVPVPPDSPGAPNGTYTFLITDAPAGHLNISSPTYPTAFAAFTTYPSIPASHTVSANVALYVDGVLIAGQSVTAKTP